MDSGADSSDVWSPPNPVPATEWSPGFEPPPAPALPARLRVLRLLAWARLGLAGTASLLLFPVGLLLLPLSAGGCALLAARGRAWPEVLEAGTGVAAFTAYVAYRNRNHTPCDSSGTTVVVTGPGQEFSCGGTAPGPWLAFAVLVLAASCGGYALALVQERRARRRAAAPAW